MMTPSEENAVARLPGAFDRLTDALTVSGRRRKYWALAFSFFLVLGLYQVQETHTQSQKNQDHIDCIIGIIARQDPPQCQDVKQDLIDGGYIPENLPPPRTSPEE